jgi:large repetitive protein
MALAVTLALACPLPVRAETPGKDLDLTVSGTVTVNAYAQVSGTASVGSPSITTVAAIPGLGVGDLVMIYQAQGATIVSTDTAAYGAVTAYNSAGRYEFQTVASVSGSTIFFATYAGNCAGLRYTYTGSSGAQVVRVPQYRDLTVNAAGSITATAWNGTTGGIVAFTVSRALTMNGTVSANAAGFRGGAIDNGASVYGYAGYRSTNLIEGGEKGESIAGYQGTLPLGAMYGRGAPANGGGGGNQHNAGGGGGANGDNGNIWAGQGIPSLATAAWATAWNLDGTLTSTTNNSGGGRGGYTYGASNQNALTVAPGNTAWGGDNRRQVGGLGGRPLAFNRANAVFFGGGGGAGDGNNSSVGGGGRGGGLAFIQTGTATTVGGSGTVSANGAAGANTTGGHNDAPGGGGGGGTILAQMSGSASINFVASGGAGGNQLITNNESEGPGGGGGGGVIAVTTGFGSRTSNGGVNGITNSASLTEFTPNGATQGAGGQPTATGPSRAEVPLCYAPPPQIGKTSAAYETVGENRFNIPQADVLYTITVTNPGTAIDGGTLTVTDLLPPELTFFNGDIDGAGPLTTNYAFIDGTPASGFSACCTLAYSAFTTGTDFTYVPAAGYDANVKRIRYTPTGSMAPGSTTATSFQIQLRARIN